MNIRDLKSAFSMQRAISEPLTDFTHGRAVFLGISSETRPDFFEKDHAGSYGARLKGSYSAFWMGGKIH